MEDVCHGQPMFATETLDLCQFGGETAAGNHAVLEVKRGSDLADSRKSGFSTLPQDGTFQGSSAISRPRAPDATQSCWACCADAFTSAA